MASLPDLAELTHNHRVVRLRTDQLPTDVARRIEESRFVGSDVIGVPLLASGPGGEPGRSPGAVEVVGALAMLAPFDREWTGTEIRFVELAAGAAWTFLRRRRDEAHLAAELDDAELLAGFGQMVADAGPEIDPDVVASMLDQLGSHIGADALVVFRASR